MPSHLAVIACLMGEMAERGIDFRPLLAAIEIEPKKPRGAASKGHFGGSKQADLFAGREQRAASKTLGDQNGT
ncbi:hypothetical protein [Chelatococcus sp. CO-6]|uniref:hypothetical protein n=1 Tax=Chelatococcus sp. CO-6 TaxID=1702325 RepID=UPI001AEBAB2F|nr:hypothetical protein [Chelatococcus sp. CO-6]